MHLHCQSWGKASGRAPGAAAGRAVASRVRRAPRAKRQRFCTYVEQGWLPNHQMEARAGETYSYYLGMLWNSSAR